MLRHAAAHAENQVVLFPLSVIQLCQTVDDLGFGILPDSAGVEQNDIGVLNSIGDAMTALGEEACHQLAVAHVHLAAVGFNIDMPRLRDGRRYDRIRDRDRLI